MQLRVEACREVTMLNRIVFVLASPSMPGLVKIGATWQESNHDSIDVGENSFQDFRCVYAGKVSSDVQTLCRFDDCFGRYRVDIASRLYSITEKQAVSLLALMVDEEMALDQTVIGRQAVFAAGGEGTEVDVDGDQKLLSLILSGSVIDESLQFDPFFNEEWYEADTKWSSEVVQWMKEDEGRSLAYHSTHEEAVLSYESDSGDPYLEDAQAREWEERAGYFRHEEMGDRSTDDIDASDHEYYEALSEVAEIQALAEEESYLEHMLSEELQERPVDEDGFAANPDGPSGEEDPHLDDPYYSWEAEDYEEQRRQLSED